MGSANAVSIIAAMVIIAWIVDFFSKRVRNRPCTVLDELTFIKIVIIYPININRPEPLVKEWNVAVVTADPDERFESHAAWMLHILFEHAYTIQVIAELENQEMRQAINSYKVTGIDNRKTVITQNLKHHEE